MGFNSGFKGLIIITIISIKIMWSSHVCWSRCGYVLGWKKWATEWLVLSVDCCKICAYVISVQDTWSNCIHIFASITQLDINFDIYMSVHRNIITNYSQKVATFLEFIYFNRRSTCFRRFLRPSSGAHNCTYSFGYCQPILQLAATVEEMERNVSWIYLF